MGCVHATLPLGESGGSGVKGFNRQGRRVSALDAARGSAPSRLTKRPQQRPKMARGMEAVGRANFARFTTARPQGRAHVIAIQFIDLEIFRAVKAAAKFRRLIYISNASGSRQEFQNLKMSTVWAPSFTV
jgi:hypothetical protein